MLEEMIGDGEEERKPNDTPAVKCHLCGGGPEEGEILGGKVHRLCVPSYIRKRGELAVTDFVRNIR